MRAWEKHLSCRCKSEGHYYLGDNWSYALDDIFREGESEGDVVEQRGHWEQQFERRRKTYQGEKDKMSLER